MSSRGWRRFWICVLLAFLTGAVFFVNVVFRDTSLSSPKALVAKLVVPYDDPAVWWNGSTAGELFQISRFLFRFIVCCIWSGLLHSKSTEVFYQVFVMVAFLCIFLTAFCYYSLLESGFRVPHKYALAGALLFLFSFPVLLGFDHTTIVYMKGEDLLAYLIVVLCLWAILCGKPLLFMLLSVLGAITRENTLLVLPAFFLHSQERLAKRLVWCIPAPVAAVVLRLVLAWSSYESLVGGGGFSFTRPLAILGWIYQAQPAMGRVNFARPMETVGCLFVTFGALWFMAVKAYLSGRKVLRTCQDSEPYRFLYRTTPLSVLLVLATTLLVGWVRENRVIFILFPWIITLAVMEAWRSDLLARTALNNLSTRKRLVIWGSVILLIGMTAFALLEIDRFRDAVMGLLNWLKGVEHSLPPIWQDLFVPMSPLQVCYLFAQVGLTLAWIIWMLSKRTRKRKIRSAVDRELI